MWIPVMMSLSMQYCAQEAAEPLMIRQDVNAKTSLDALVGREAPQNLVVFGDIALGLLPAFLDDLTVEDDALRRIESESVGFGSRYTVGPLEAGRAYRFSLSPFDLTVEPAGERRDIDVEVGATSDLEPPVIDEDPIATRDTRDAHLAMGCVGLPMWIDEEHITTVALPEAHDDFGIAAWELRVTEGGFERVADVEIEGFGDGQLVAQSFGDPPERIRVVAHDHAGNASPPRDVGHVHDHGCAQTGRSAHALALLLAVLGVSAARRSRRSVRRAL